MAKGAIHFNRAKVVASAAEVSGWVLAAVDPTLPLAVSVGNVLGMMLTPDMDDPGTTYPEYVVGWLFRQALWHCGVRNRGTLADAENVGKKLLAAVTAPYGVFIPHRSWLSHLPPIGTLTKVTYLYCLYYVISCVIGFEHITPRVLASTPQVWYTIFVWAVHDSVHLLDDGGMIQFNGKRQYLFGHTFYRRVNKRNED
jgi:uncharacterized metal-binding protein